MRIGLRAWIVTACFAGCLVIPRPTPAASPPPTDATSQLEVAASTDVSYTAISYGVGPVLPAPTSAHKVSGGGQLGATIYLGDPVVDDSAPLSLQPFLQRRSTATVNGGGSGFQLAAATYDRHGASGTVGLGLAGYPQRSLYLSASFGARYQTWRDTDKSTGGVWPAVSTWELPVSVSAGARFHEVLLEAGWSITPSRTDRHGFSVPFWGGAFVRGKVVVGGRTELIASVAVTNEGAGASAYVERFFGRCLGVWLSVHGGHMVDPEENASEDWVGGELGVAYWFTRSLKASLAYTGEWVSIGVPDPRSSVMHRVGLGLTARF
jgi:hypothetical protein